MASTVIDLITHLEKAMLDYNECQLWIFLESNEWKTFQSGCEDLMAFLEFSGHPLTASRIFQGFTDVIAAAQQSDKDSWLEDSFGVQQKVAALLIRLKAINRSWSQVQANPQIPEVRTKPCVSEHKALSPAVHAAWGGYQTALSRGNFNSSAPTDREVYDWVLIQMRTGDKMPDFDTWQRYIRKARNFYGCQKNTARYGREHGSSIVHRNQL